jgi:hypothetical protein
LGCGAEMPQCGTLPLPLIEKYMGGECAMYWEANGHRVLVGIRMSLENKRRNLKNNIEMVHKEFGLNRID